MPKEDTRPTVVQKQKTQGFTVTFPYVGQKRTKFHFSNKELRDLSIGVLLVAGVGLSLVGFQSIVYLDVGMLAVYTVMFTTSFFMHEIAHKAVAQSYGLWAEFRLTLTGTLLTLLSIISPFIKIIAPGAVMVAGPHDRKTMGKTSVAGPATNLTLATLLIALTFVIPSYSLILARVAFFNGWIAIFNLIPIGILDGLKVFTWDKRIWALSFSVSLAVTIASYLYF
jgi:Zn-dependent protease